MREATELLMGLNDNFDEVITGRKNNSTEYQDYIQRRRMIKPDYYTLVNNNVEKVDTPHA